jgi:hypothetical protein
LSDLHNHELQMAEVAGTQKSADPDWNGARMAYWGTTDVQSGHGKQRGYFNNERANGDRDWGTFEGTVSMAGGAITVEGSFAITGGSGKFQGVTGKGTYRGRFTSPTEIEMEWKGEYQLAGARTRGAA